MAIIEKAKSMISNKELKEASKDIVEDLIGALSGNPVAVGKLILLLAEMPSLVSEKLLWRKIEQFLSGVPVLNYEKDDFYRKINEEGAGPDNCRRLIQCIDKIEDERKIKHIINATNALIKEEIDVEIYFRICNAIEKILEEDLQFLKTNIELKDLPYDIQVQGLFAGGLMFNSIISECGDPKFSFNKTAGFVDKYALSYGDTQRYEFPETFLIEEHKMDITPSVPAIPQNVIESLE